MLKDNDGHLFGRIILNTTYHTAGSNQPELVDGQQRLTTLIILLKSFENAYRKKQKMEKADEIKKVILSKSLDDVELPKIQLVDLDNEDIEQLILDNKTESITNKNIKAAYRDYLEWLIELEISELNKFFYSSGY